MLQGLVLLIAMGWLLASSLKKGNGMPAFILLGLGIFEMVLRDVSVFPAPHWLQQAIAITCFILWIIATLLYRLREPERGTRRRPRGDGEHGGAYLP